MDAWTPHPRKQEAGFAMLVAVLLVLLTSAIAISAIEHSGSESAISGRFRRSAVTFYAADAGIQVAVNRVNQNPPNMSGFTLTTADGTTFRTGPKTAAGAQPLALLGTGPPPDGYCIGTGASCFRTDLYRTQVAAFAIDGAATELESQFSVLQAGTGGY
ncbi:MAG: hypothetical protein ACE5IL_07505 [Myxococcota bacterium]